MHVFKTTVGVILITIFTIAAIIGLFLLGWWLKEYAVNRNAEINQNTFGRQNTLVEQILDDISEAEGNIPSNQRIAIIDGVCDSAAKLTGTIQIPFNAQRFIQENC
jgi:hypothetical protein